MKIRVGFGFDVHQLVEGRELWLGGVLLEHTKGLLGHSDADVLLHVIDISSPDMLTQIEVVEDLINRLGAGSTPCIRVYNKCDRYIGVLPRGENIVCISARTGEGTAELVKKIAEILGRESRRVTLLLPYDKAGIADTLRREAAVLSVEYGEDGVKGEAVVKPELWGLVRGYVQEGE